MNSELKYVSRKKLWPSWSDVVAIIFLCALVGWVGYSASPAGREKLQGTKAVPAVKVDRYEVYSLPGGSFEYFRVHEESGMIFSCYWQTKKDQVRFSSCNIQPK